MNYFRDYDFKIQKAMRDTDAFFANKDVKWEDDNQHEVEFKKDINNFYSQPQPKIINIRHQKYENK